MCVLYHVHAVLVGPEEGTEFPEAGVTGSCKLPGGCWEADLVPLQEQQVPLTVEHLSSPYSLYFKTLIHLFLM